MWKQMTQLFSTPISDTSSKPKRDYGRSRVVKPKTPEEKIKAYTNGPITGEVNIVVKPQGLTLEFETEQKAYQQTYDEYTPRRYQFTREEGQNPKVTKEGDKECIEFRLKKIK